MKIEIIRDLGRFLALEPEWNMTLRRSRSDNPFLTFQWLRSWLEVFGNSCLLRVIIARDGNELAAMAPLAIDPKKRLFFIGYPLSDYCDIIVAEGREEALSAILDHLFAGKREWDKMILDQLGQDCSHAGEMADYLTMKGLPFRSLKSDLCPAMAIDNVETARKVFYKRNITTYVNWFEKQGEFRFNVYHNTSEALRRLDDLFNQHRQRRDLTPFPSQFENDAIRRFFWAFMQSMHSAGWARLFSLTLDREFLALYIGFEYNDKLYLYTTSFNPHYARRSPGQVILRYLFDYSVERGINHMDFARGDESYKDRFSNISRQNTKIIVYKNAVSRKAADLFFAFRYSRLVDVLYRNKRVQDAKFAFLFRRRKRGLIYGLLAGMKTLVSPQGKA